MVLQPHLKISKDDINKNVILPGDPARVLRIIKHLKSVKKVSENRGYLIYNGAYEGVPITVCSTGMGGPSIAIAIHELVNCGAKLLIRVGSCGALQVNQEISELVIPSQAVREDGVTRLYVNDCIPAMPDKSVYNALIKSADELGHKYYTGTSRSHDGFYQKDNAKLEKFWSNAGLVASDFETAPLFIISKCLGVKSGSVLNIISPYGKAIKGVAAYSLMENKAMQGELNSIIVALNAIKTLNK